MVELVFKYKGKSETFQVASSWDELDKKQLLYIAQYWEAWRLLARNNESLLRAKALLLFELINGNTIFNRKKRVDLFAQLQNEELYELTQITNFVFKSNDLLKCPVKCISKGFKKLYAPNNGLGNVTAFEFTFADDFFLKYFDSGNVEHLDLLISCLYRPIQRKTKVRVVFDKANINDSVKIVKRLSYAEKQLILLWYHGCRKKIIDNNADLFSNSDAKNRGWLPVILGMAGDKFGTFDQTGNTDLHLILMELKEMKERSKPKPTT